ncbi:hypothetical protein RND81_09G022700 [Saponaria officinalis]|uniref:Uncharacterized protein n=1 Tax=Saponaria officinalis TaxID=3572 RepID=A0AAW1IGZ3_SAPOF
MAVSPAAFSTKLAAPLCHLLLHTSAVSLAGKLATDRTPVIFDSIQKPVLRDRVVNTVLFGRVESPATRSLSQQAMKSVNDDDVDDNVPLDEDDFDEDDSDFDTDDEDFMDDDDDGDDDQKS